MLPLEVLRRHPLVLAGLVGASVGVLIGLFLPIRAAAPAAGQEMKWSLPGAASLPRYSEPGYSALQRATFWGDQATMSGASKKSAWQLRAIMTRPLHQVAVTITGSPAQKQQWIRLGGALPDGATLVEINQDSIGYVQDGCRQSRKLYAAAASKAAGTAAGDEKSCVPATATPQGAAQRSPDPQKSIGK